MAGIVRQADQYGLDVPDPREVYASVPEAEVAHLLRPGLRVHTGTNNHRVSRETSEVDFGALHYADGNPGAAVGINTKDDFANALGDFQSGHYPSPSLKGVAPQQLEEGFMNSLGEQGKGSWHPSGGIDDALSPVTQGLTNFFS